MCSEIHTLRTNILWSEIGYGVHLHSTAAPGPVDCATHSRIAYLNYIRNEMCQFVKSTRRTRWHRVSITYVNISTPEISIRTRVGSTCRYVKNIEVASANTVETCARIMYYMRMFTVLQSAVNVCAIPVLMGCAANKGNEWMLSLKPTRRTYVVSVSNCCRYFISRD